jgi:hypothetical protein
MDILTQTFQDRTLLWLLLTTTVSVIAGLVSSLLTYRLVRRRELIESANIDIHKQRELRAEQAESEKKERIRQEALRWANPILAAVDSLYMRLKNILTEEGYLALKENYIDEINPNWSISYEYFMTSTLFLFCEYFAWIQMMMAELNFELFESQDEKDRLFGAVYAVARALSSFPPKYACSNKDTQVFVLQQRVLGELLTMESGDRRSCMTYSEFLTAMVKSPLQEALVPLKRLLEDLPEDDEDDCRWKRLEATMDELHQLRSVCRHLLNIS